MSHRYMLIVLGAFVLCPTVGHAKDTSCISDAEFEAQVGAEIRAGYPYIDMKRFAGRSLCSGEPFVRKVQRMRDEAFPEEREARLAKERWVMEQSHRNHVLAEQDRQLADQRRRELERLHYEAEVAQAKRAAAIARAETADADLTAARKRILLAQLPPGEPMNAAVLYGPTPVFDGEMNANLNAIAEQKLAEDAQSWWLEWLHRGYQPGTVRNAQLVARDYATNSYVIFANFSYRDGTPSWLKIKYTAGEFDCIAFKDEPDNCRAIGDTPSVRFGMNSLMTLVLGRISSK